MALTQADVDFIKTACWAVNPRPTSVFQLLHPKRVREQRARQDISPRPVARAADERGLAEVRVCSSNAAEALLGESSDASAPALQNIAGK